MSLLRVGCVDIYGIDCRFSLDIRLVWLGLLLLILSAVILIVFKDKFCRNLAALDRKISAELAPKHDENGGTKVKHEQSQHTSESKNANIEHTQHTQNQKPSMVAEPMIRYREVNSREKSESSNFRKYYKL